MAGVQGRCGEGVLGDSVGLAHRREATHMGAAVKTTAVGLCSERESSHGKRGLRE